MSETYKPTEHAGLKQDGTPDQRVGTGQFAQGQVDPVEAGKLGRLASAGITSIEETTGNSGGSAKGGFAHGKVDPHEAGRLGGLASAGTVDRTSTDNSRRNSKGEFAHGKVDPVEAGRLGGSATGPK